MTFAAAGGDKSSERLARLRILYGEYFTSRTYNKVKEKVEEATRDLFFFPPLFFIPRENRPILHSVRHYAKGRNADLIEYRTYYGCVEGCQRFSVSKAHVHREDKRKSPRNIFDG